MLIENFWSRATCRSRDGFACMNAQKKKKLNEKTYQEHMNLRLFIDCSQQKKKKRTEITKIAHRYSAWKLARKLFNFQVRILWGAFEKWTSIKDHRTCNSNRHTFIRSCTRFSKAPEFKWQKEIAKHPAHHQCGDCLCLCFM